MAKNVYYTLRIAVAMCFIGHGAFGIITKAVWCNYFAVFGISQSMAYRLMPVVGVFDILCGLTMLLYPIRLIPVWLLVWGVVTALLRPLSGEPFAECIERAGNYGAAMALLLLAGSPVITELPGPSRSHKRWWVLLDPIWPKTFVNKRTRRNAILCLRVVCFLLLLGHGWLGLLGKKSLLGQYASLGLAQPATIAVTVGVLEIAAAILLLFRPNPVLLAGLIVWKMISELFYPHYELFEWIERGGSYGCLLALAFLCHKEIKNRRFSAV